MEVLNNMQREWGKRKSKWFKSRTKISQVSLGSRLISSTGIVEPLFTDFQALDKDSQNWTVKSQSTKVINLTKTHLEVSATSENNSKFIVGEETPCRWRAFCHISDLRRKIQDIHINESKIDQVLRIHVSLGLFSWLVVCLSRVCLPKHSHWELLIQPPWCLFPQAPFLDQRTTPWLKGRIDSFQGREKGSAGIYLPNYCLTVQFLHP